MDTKLKADCLAIVNDKNDTLWVRSATYAANLAAQALDEFRKVSYEPLTLLKSFTDAHGVEKAVELMTVWADACLEATASGAPVPSAALVEIWLDKAPMFGLGPQSDHLKPSAFEHVASIWVPMIEDADVMLDKGFAASQNIDSAWKPSKPCRSSSVGDVFVLRRAGFSPCAFRVASIGFTPVEFSENTPELVASR